MSKRQILYKNIRSREGIYSWPKIAELGQLKGSGTQLSQWLELSYSFPNKGGDELPVTRWAGRSWMICCSLQKASCLEDGLGCSWELFRPETLWSDSVYGWREQSSSPELELSQVWCEWQWFSLLTLGEGWFWAPGGLRWWVSTCPCTGCCYG